MKKFKDVIKAVCAKAREADAIRQDLYDRLKPYADNFSSLKAAKNITLYFNPPVSDVMKIVNIVCDYPGATEYLSGQYELKNRLEQPFKFKYKGKAYSADYHSAHISINLQRGESITAFGEPPSSNVLIKIRVSLNYRHPKGSIESQWFPIDAFIRVLH